MCDLKILNRSHDVSRAAKVYLAGCNHYVI